MSKRPLSNEALAQQVDKLSPADCLRLAASLIDKGGDLTIALMIARRGVDMLALVNLLGRKPR
jgi:hypothetical protein